MSNPLPPKKGAPPPPPPQKQYPQSYIPPQNQYPQQQYPPQNQYPPQQQYPPQPYTPPQQQYPPQNQYPPQYPPQQQFPPQNQYPPQPYTPPQQQFPPQNQYPPHYPPQQQYPPQNQYPPQYPQQPFPPQPYPPQHSVPTTTGAPPNINFKIPPTDKFSPSSGVGQVSIKVHSGRNLIVSDLNGSSDAYIVARTPSEKKTIKTKVIQKNLNPFWNETLLVDISNPQYDLIVLECMDHDAIGKDESLGFIVIDPSILPKGIEVSTTEKLSYVPHGEILISITAINFGIENAPPNYSTDYINWRNQLPPVSKKGKEKEKKKGGKAKTPKTTHNKASGPFSSKVPPAKYNVINGWVKKYKKDTEATKQVKKVGKKAFGFISNLVE